MLVEKVPKWHAALWISAAQAISFPYGAWNDLFGSGSRSEIVAGKPAFLQMSISFGSDQQTSFWGLTAKGAVICPTCNFPDTPTHISSPQVPLTLSKLVTRQKGISLERKKTLTEQNIWRLVQGISFTHHKQDNIFQVFLFHLNAW